MFLLTAFLTFVLILNCLFLILLILIQLPKKEAGAGIAFGGAATDALFGAGSGNALTRLTKYSAGIFVALSVVLSVLNMHAAKAGSRRLEQEISRQATARPLLPTTLPTVSSQTTSTFVSPPITNASTQVQAPTLMSTALTNVPVHATNAEAPVAPAK